MPTADELTYFLDYLHANLRLAYDECVPGKLQASMEMLAKHVLEFKLKHAGRKASENELYFSNPNCPCHLKHKDIRHCECACHKNIGLEDGGRLWICSVLGCANPSTNPPNYHECPEHAFKGHLIGYKK